MALVAVPVTLYAVRESRDPSAVRRIDWAGIGTLSLGMGLVVLALVRFGLVTYPFMARTRPYAIVLIFILATIITPTPDVLTLIAMSLPMVFLYESCIWIAWFMQRRRSTSTAS